MSSDAKQEQEVEEAPLEFDESFTTEEKEAIAEFVKARKTFNSVRYSNFFTEVHIKAFEDVEKKLPISLAQCPECKKRLKFDGVEYHWTCPDRNHSELLVFGF